MFRIKVVPILGILLSFVVLTPFAWQPGMLQVPDERPGIECGCSEVGDYVEPTSKPIESVQEGESPSGKYQLEAVPASPGYHITITQDGHIILNETFSAGAYWGFSSDDDSFVIHGLSEGRHYVWLYNLDPDPDTDYEYANLVWSLVPGLETGSSRIRFSPHGSYLLYAAITSTGGLFLRVVDTQYGNESYQGDTSSIYSSLSGDGVAGWGFSSDIWDATYVSAYLVSADRYDLHVVNLTTGEDVYTRHQAQGDAHWEFSPCGDVFGLIDYDDGTIYLYKTLEQDSTLGGATAVNWDRLSVDWLSDENEYWHTAHYLDGSTDPIIENTADDPCPDLEPPTWPDGSSLTASDIAPFSLTLNWSEAEDNVGVTGYQVYQRTEPLDLVAADVLTYSVTDLSPATEYTFKVEAKDAAGNESDDGPSVTVNTPSAVPAWPGDASLTASNIGVDSLTLTWTAAQHEVGVTDYQIYIGTDPLVTVTGDPPLTYDATGLTPHTTYTFAVQACNTLDYCSTDGPSTVVTTTGDVLSITKTDAPDPVWIGSYLTYTLVVTNHNPSGATGVILTDTLPAEVNLFSVTFTQGDCSESGGEIACILGDLVEGESAMVTIVVTPTEEETITNMASVTSNEFDPDSTNNTAIERTIVTSWILETIDDGIEFALDADSSGYAHICYHQWSGTTDQLNYATNASGSWVTETLETGLIGSCAIALDSSDTVHIAYAETVTTTWDTLLQYTNNVTGSWQPSETVTRSTDGIWSVSMALDPEEHLHMSYIKAWGAASMGSLMYATNAFGEWIVEPVDTVQSAYDYASLAVDSKGRVHISFYSIELSGLYYVAQGAGRLWQPPELVDRVGGQLEGMVTSIAVDSEDRPHISYVGGPMEDYRYATLIGGSWYTETVDSGDFWSGGNGIAVDPWDQVHMIYYHMASEQLRYATLASGSWITKAVDWKGWTNAFVIDELGTPHICYGSGWWYGPGSITYGTKDVAPAPDSDGDGVPDGEESGPDGTDGLYDGNGDGIPDSQQGNVASFHTYDREHYVTLAIPDGTALSDVQAVDNPSPSDTPSGVDFAYGFFAFTIDNVEVGGAVTATFHLSTGTTPITTYYKHGPTPGNPVNHWHEFLYDGETGAETNENVVTLHFVDGQRGDHDLIANGQIVEPGGPATPPNKIFLPLVLKGSG